MEDKSTTLKYTLRIPTKLLEEIKRKAQSKEMSINAYILLVLSQKLN